MSARLEALGFDRGRAWFATYTALAACLAVLLAWAFGLEHPQWAGMSVWAASQPLRGQVFEKSLFRIAGSLVGIGVGIALVLGYGVSPWILVFGLAAWIALCTWGNNMLRGLPAYGTVLAGYSASMVALLDTSHPEQVFALGLDRALTVLTGVAVVALAGAIFAPQSPLSELRARLAELSAKALAHGAEPKPDAAQTENILQKIAAFEESLEPHAAGSRRRRDLVAAFRVCLLALTGRLLRGGETAVAPATLTALQRGDFAAAAAALPGQPDLAAALRHIGGEGAAPARPALHKDRPGAGEAALRAGAVMALGGMLWQMSGWPQGSYLLLGLSVMLSIFSSIELPVQLLRHVIFGQVLAGLAAVLCQLVFWPMADSTLGQVLIMMPFMLLGIPLTAHKKTVLASMDYHLVFLLLMMPHLPLTASFASASLMAGAVVLAPVIALVCYSVIFPVNLQRRAAHLRKRLRIYAAEPGGARLAHGALRFLRLQARQARPSGEGIGILRSMTRAEP